MKCGHVMQTENMV